MTELWELSGDRSYLSSFESSPFGYRSSVFPWGGFRRRNRGSDVGTGVQT